MARTILVEASPWNATTAAAVPVYLAGGGSKAYRHRSRNDWLAGVVSEPVFSARIEFDQNGFSGGARAQFGSLEFAAAQSSTVNTLNALLWIGAPIEVLVGDDALAVPTWTTVIKGTVATFSISRNIISLTIRDASGELDIPLVDARFTGAGGIEGDVAVADRLKRRTWGRAFNVEAKMLVSAENIHELGDPAFPLQSIDVVRDIGRSASSLTVLAWQGSIAATLAALVAAAAPQGGGVVAPSIACVKWWTRPVGPLTADIKGEVGAGYFETVASIASRLVAVKSALTISNVAAINGIRGDAAGIHVDNSAETTAQALDRLLKGVSIVWNATAAGVIDLSEIKLTGPVETVSVIEADRAQVFKPVRTRRVGYQRNQRVHGDGEISQAQELQNWLQPNAPTFDETLPAQRWIDTDDNNREYQRTDGFLAIGGTIPTIGGFPIYITWRSISDLRVEVALNNAAAAQAAANLAQALAADAQATADGKIDSFYQNDPPAVASEGDIWFDTNDGNKQYRRTSGAWVLAQDTAIGTAISAAAGAQATADGKITTFISETTPTAEADGDLWFKASTGQLRRWNAGSSTWGDPLVDLTSVSQVTASLSPDKIVAADYLGAVSSDNLAALIWAPSVIQGGTSIKGANTTSYSISGTYGGTFAVDNTNGSSTKGNVTISVISSNTAGGVLNITVNGVALPSLPFKVDKDLAAAPAPAGGTDSETFSSGDFLSLNGTSYVAISTVKTLTLATGQSLYGTAALDYTVNGNVGASRTLTAKWQYSVAGSGSWNDFASGVAGSAAIGALAAGPPDYEYIDGSPGFLSLPQTKSGLGAGNYDVRIVALLNTTGRTVTVSGSALMEAKT